MKTIFLVWGLFVIIMGLYLPIMLPFAFHSQTGVKMAYSIVAAGGIFFVVGLLGFLFKK